MTEWIAYLYIFRTKKSKEDMIPFKWSRSVLKVKTKVIVVAGDSKKQVILVFSIDFN